MKMTDFYLPGVVVISLVLLYYWLDSKAEKRRKNHSIQGERDRFTDENIFKAQYEFERNLNENADLPDGIRRQRAYIYRHLMSGWFATLIAKHRYNDAMSSKIKSDWLDYLYFLERGSTVSYLWSESDNEKKQDSYGKESWLISQQYMAIEESFAAAIGNNALAELQQVRSASPFRFDRSGIKPIAPEGFHYFPVSGKLNDESLVPDRPEINFLGSSSTGDKGEE